MTLNYSLNSVKEMKYLNVLGLAILTFSVFASAGLPERSESNVVAQVASVEVDAIGNVQVNGRALPMADLSTSLAKMSLKAPVFVLLNISSDLPMGKHNGLMRELRSSSISGISWKTEIGDGGKGVEFFRLTN